MTIPRAGRPIEVLLVEDNLGDILIMEETFQEAGVPNRLSVARDGAEALDFLHRRGRHAAAPRPDLILLDLNLPRRNGREVLGEIRSDPALRRIPVVILTTSAAEEDVLRSYDLHANSYITKPADLKGLLNVLRSIEAYWLSIVKLPAK
jgi:CheY-like chemotaxis protein